MGYDLTRFQGDVDEELICSICSGVLEEPMQAPACEHAFCRMCINEWICRHPTCPVDRQAITCGHLRPVPRITRNLLSRLNINCDNVAYGCTTIIKLDRLSIHLSECEFNPKKPIPCEEGCGLVIPKDEVKEHNCVRELRNLMQKKQDVLEDFKVELAEQRRDMNGLKRELIMLKEMMMLLKISNPAVRVLGDEFDQESVLNWSNTLPRARVTRWGGMISTPDELLQTMIKRALLESGCPTTIVEGLMQNCHERRWPPGLCSLETRQTNRRNYDQYVCKRVPGKQAVVVLHCDNAHMTDDMMLEPGLVMIFAHGIE